MVLVLLIFCILLASVLLYVLPRETRREKAITVQHYRPFVERGNAAKLEEEQNPCECENVEDCQCSDPGRLIVLADVPRVSGVAALLP